ncbi:solute:Na+ symporter, SSS family protein [Catellatospora sp. TT07R-123]|uniref:sodium:solute symporter family protein n=1 Tax=Catellatospora sp. TT07R-123 TaxID=2733863 RepID=UPI001B07EC98|nr:sodium:solute symporter [Catellatospora sp. TT07R-123]GHJ45190.1 solute:Na+ symporter, SSS family protein [Catellatospora sp. TT07R-123]
MTDRQLEIGVFAALLALMLLLGFYAARWRRPHTPHSLEEWGVGGRAFGNWVTWFLLGGSMYTAYTYIAVPALMYGAGAVGFFAVPFAIVTAPMAYVISTRTWSVSHAHGFVTSAEFARARFGSRSLAALVAATGIVATLPYIAVQLIALQAMLKTLGVTGEWPLLLAVGVASACTFRAGLRAPALLSIAKDALLLWLLLSVALLIAMSGGWTATFRGAATRLDGDLSPATGLLLPQGGAPGYLTLVLGSALAIFAYPHALTGILAARDRATVQRNTAALPVYCLALGLLALLGFFAIGQGVRPVGGDLNTVVPQLFHEAFPAWCAGIAYAAIAVAALIPAAVMSIAAANLFTRGVYREYLRPRASSAEEALVSRWVSLLAKVGALAFIVLLDPRFSVELQLVGGVIVLQTVPAVVLGLWTAWFHRFALIGGLLSGLAAGVLLLWRVPQRGADGAVVRAHFGGSNLPLSELGLGWGGAVYVGVLALAVNLLVVVGATVVLRGLRVPAGADLTRPEDYHADAGDGAAGRAEDLIDGRSARTPAHAR